MNTDILVLFLLYYVYFGACVVKTWRYDSDIYNPVHWVGGKPGQKCDGLDLRNAKQAVLVIDHLETKQIFLPSRDVRIFFPEGTRISLHENTTMDCVQVKTNNFGSHSWNDPASWIIEGAEDNPAVPHMERVPCDYDDVVFPKGWKSSQCTIRWIWSDVVRLRSFKFGRDYVKDGDLRDLQLSNINTFSGMLRVMVDIEDITCNDRVGCLCGPYLRKSSCNYVKEPEEYQCENPIQPIGFCTKICGARILIENTTSPEFTSKFDIQNVRKALRGYSSATYVSKVNNGYFDASIQIIFTEKDFTGASLDDAKDFYSILLADDSFGVTSAVLLSSGLLINEGKAGRTAVSIVFGTLLGVLLAFGLIFFVNSPQFARLNLRNRLHITSRPLSTLLARYDKMDEETLAFQRAESVASLKKSFDNPMYGTSAPSTSSTITGPEEKASKAEICLENPMYDIKGLTQTEIDDTVMEESQLVDLTPSKNSTVK